MTTLWGDPEPCELTGCDRDQRRMVKLPLPDGKSKKFFICELHYGPTLELADYLKSWSEGILTDPPT